MILRAVMIVTALGAALALSVAIVSGAQAAYVVTFLQVGPDVVATGDGSLDLAGLVKQPDPHFGVAAVAASIGAEITGPASSTGFSMSARPDRRAMAEAGCSRPTKAAATS
jgi:hypothetical protein